MRDDILEKVARDLLSIPPLTFRGIRRKLIKSTLSDIDEGITPLHFEIIRLLEEEGTLHVAEIGTRLQIAKAQMTQLIDKLVALKIVERKTDITDRRTINISLTNQGRIFLKDKFDRLMVAVRDTMSCLTDEELETLSVSLSQVRDVLAKLP